MRGHYIKPNHRCESLQHAVFVDTETDPEQLDTDTVGHVLRQGWAAYTRRQKDGKWSTPEWFRFTDLNKFWHWCEQRCRRKTKLYVFCHNTNFDLPVLDAFTALPRMGWVPDRLVIEAPPTILRLKKEQRTMMLLDTLNYWAVPLKKLGESIGLPKLDMPPDDAPVDDWDTYNKRDVEIIMRAVQLWSDLVVEKDLGGFQPTLASQSFAAWCHRFMPTKVLIDSHDHALAVARECYHGGRTEAFFIGSMKKRVHLLDINSMYPAMMSKESYPTILAHYSTHVNTAKLKYLMKKYKLCAHMRVRVDRPAVGVYRDDRYIFPVGEFNAHLSTPEIAWILKHGEVVKVHAVAAYQHAKIFEKFVKVMYAWRQEYQREGNEVFAFMVKILLNSLYGKFGQRGIRYEDEYKTGDLGLDVWTEVNYQTKQTEKYRKLMGVVQRLVREGEASNSHPAIAAHVTADARMLLWRMMEIAGTDHLYYTDTDSLLVDDTGLSRLTPYIDPTELGKLKHEATYHYVEINGAKDYRFGDKVRIKGVRQGATWLDDNTVEQEKWSGLKGLLRAGRLDQPTTRIIEKHLTRDYLKGTVLPDGRVAPFVLG